MARTTPPVERVHAQSLVQLVGRAGHLGQHEHPAVPVVAGKVLLAHEVHAVAQRVTSMTSLAAYRLTSRSNGSER